MNNLLAKVRDIAINVRLWAVGVAAEKEDDSDLTGYCAIASGRLHNELLTHGIQSEIRMSVNGLGCHVFLMIEDHIVDITATQFKEFSKDTILIRHEKELSQHGFYESAEVFASTKALRSYQLRSEWPDDQIVYPSMSLFNAPLTKDT